MPPHHDVLGATVDTGWWATQGYDPVRAIGELGERVLHVHLKDVHAGEHVTCRWGEGIVPVRECVERLPLGLGGQRLARKARRVGDQRARAGRRVPRLAAARVRRCGACRDGLPQHRHRLAAVARRQVACRAGRQAVAQRAQGVKALRTVAAADDAERCLQGVAIHLVDRQAARTLGVHPGILFRSRDRLWPVVAQRLPQRALAP